ncbi:MAG: hypothetical protein MSC45_05345 [Mobiluncus sp.]|uniref:hypothetical protein n=1 Tax=Mobiluncus sp. TaxID=47293 RepID=UPI002587918A|nr:hypothetical protein [Mobiluncus sp.]MCI6584476.1 hypothetical protein [Mobiluncus sp.]
MIFTDGQLLTADDINSFLLNRETNPALDEAKTQALTRIETLKNQIPQGGTELTNLPQGFIKDSVVQAWKLNWTRNTQVEIYQKDPGIGIKADEIPNCRFIYLEYETKSIPIFSTDYDTSNHASCPFIRQGWPHEDMGFKYKNEIENGETKEIYFITINKRIESLELVYHSEYYTEAAIEEITNEIPQLL